MAKHPREENAVITTREMGLLTVMEVEGEFADQVAEEFVKLIDGMFERNRFHVVLDMTKAKWTSLKALKYLVRYVKKFREKDGDIKLAGINPYLSNLLNLTGTTVLFDVYRTVEMAVAVYDLR